MLKKSAFAASARLPLHEFRSGTAPPRGCRSARSDGLPPTAPLAATTSPPVARLFTRTQGTRASFADVRGGLRRHRRDLAAFHDWVNRPAPHLAVSGARSPAKATVHFTAFSPSGIGTLYIEVPVVVTLPPTLPPRSGPFPPRLSHRHHVGAHRSVRLPRFDVLRIPIPARRAIIGPRGAMKSSPCCPPTRPPNGKWRRFLDAGRARRTRSTSHRHGLRTAGHRSVCSSAAYRFGAPRSPRPGWGSQSSDGGG